MKWLADENFSGIVVRALRARIPEIDIVRAQDLEFIRGQDDDTLLAWATRTGRIVLTHDASTMLPAVKRQFHSLGQCCAVVVVPTDLAVAQALGDIQLLECCGVPEDFSATMIHLPL